MKNALYFIQELRQIEESAIAEFGEATLMQRAGQAVADIAQTILREVDSPARRDILILVGPGNNGGDALEAACYLQRTGFSIKVLLTTNPQEFKPDVAAIYENAQQWPLSFKYEWEDAQYALIIDGLFGIGLSRPLTDQWAFYVSMINRASCPVLSIDLPSGLDADTGNVIGEDSGCAVRASHTVTMIADKPGLHTAHGKDYAGSVYVAALAIDESKYPQSRMLFNTPDLFTHLFKPRHHASHKGDFGEVALINQNSNTLGASILAARAAAFNGSGKIFLHNLSEKNPQFVNVVYPEIIVHEGLGSLNSKTTWVAGPGMGTDEVAIRSLKELLNSDCQCVLDADALTLIAHYAALKAALVKRKAATILTPHPLEAARLLSCSVEQIQAHRVKSAQTLASELNCVVVLKGSGSIIAKPDGLCIINGTGNPILATAGSGDVLAGICAAYMAQNVSALEEAFLAAAAAVWIHGKAADHLLTEHGGTIGMLASELIPITRNILNHLIYE